MFKKQGFAVWIVQIPKDTLKWQQGHCTCPQYMQKYLCKHLIGLAIRLKYAKAIPAAKQIPIGTKRRRGRPK